MVSTVYDMKGKVLAKDVPVCQVKMYIEFELPSKKPIRQPPSFSEEPPSPATKEDMEFELDKETEDETVYFVPLNYHS